MIEFVIYIPNLRLGFMDNIDKKNSEVTKSSQHIGTDFFDEFWEESWTYIRTVVDVVREPVMLLDKNCNILAANEAFYQLFQVGKNDIEGKSIYKIGNGQWNIPALRKLLVDILPKNTFFKGFEVDREFPIIGRRTLIINARHIYSKDKTTSKLFPPIIMIAIDDVSEIMTIANKLTQYTSQLEKTLATRTNKMEKQIYNLEKKINGIARK